LTKSHHDLISLFEHDLFGKPVPTFPDHAVDCCNDEDAMTVKFSLLLSAIAVVALSVAPASAQSTRLKYDRDGRVTYGANGPNRSYQQGPRTRVYVTTRSWLDAGTEVLPGDRKFQDYAFPPAIGYPSFARENLNRPIDRQPLNPPSDLGGYPTRFPLPYW
jgi:hypothetical protein